MSTDSQAKAKGFLKKVSSKRTILLGSFVTDVVDTLHDVSLAIQSSCYSPGYIIKNVKVNSEYATGTNREVNAKLPTTLYIIQSHFSIACM